MNASLLAVLAGFFTLAINIMNEFFSAKARQREQQEKFDKTELEFNTLAQKALIQMQINTILASKQSQNIQDRLDQHVGSNNEKPKT